MGITRALCDLEHYGLHYFRYLCCEIIDGEGEAFVDPGKTIYDYTWYVDLPADPFGYEIRTGPLDEAALERGRKARPECNPEKLRIVRYRVPWATLEESEADLEALLDEKLDY